MSNPVQQSVSGNGKRNYAKIGEASQQLLASIVQEYLDFIEKPHLIDGHVQRNNYLRYKLRPDELSLIARANKKGYSDFDIPLVYKIIRNLKLVSPPTKGWGSHYDPSANEISIGDDMERIRRKRNEILHRGNTNVSDAEYKNYFSLFKDIAERFEHHLSKNKGHYVSKFETLENFTVEAEIEKIIKGLESVRKKERKLTGTVMKLRQALDCMMVHDTHKMQIEEWEKEDEKFVETEIVVEIRDKLQLTNTLIVTGVSGVGKSSHIHHVALSMRQDGYKIVPCISPADMTNYFKLDQNQVFVFDDVGGRYTVIQSDIENWLKYEPRILNILKEDGNKLMASCRLQIFREEQFKRLILFTDFSVELSSKSVNSKQKLAIAKQYLSPDVVKSIEHIVDKCDFFPLKCALYSSDSHAEAVHFFQNLFDIYMDEFSNLLAQEDKTKYFALTLLVLCNGVLKFPCVADNGEHVPEHDSTLLKLLEDYEVPKMAQKIHIIQHLDSFVDTYIARESMINEFGIIVMVTYKSLHDKLLDYLSYHCGTKKQTAFIAHANSSVLSQRVQLKSLNADHDDLTIMIEEHNEEMYFARILNDLREGNAEDVFQCRQILHADYRKKLVDKMSEDRDILNDLFKGTSCRQKTIYHIFASGQIDLIKFALRNVNSLNSLMIDAYSYDTPIMKAFKSFIAKFGGINSASISLRVFEGPCRRYSPLVCACFHGHTNIAQLLIREGAQVDGNASYNGITPLIAAISKKQTDVVQMLEDKEVNVSIADKNMCTPLIWACKWGFYTFVHDNIDKLDIEGTDKRGQTPLLFACRYGHLKMVHLLVEKGADISRTSPKKWSPLMAACRGCHTEIVQYLLNKGSGINAVDIFGNTPLQLVNKNPKTTKRDNLVRFLTDNEPDDKPRDIDDESTLVKSGNVLSLFACEETVIGGQDIDLTHF